MLNTLFVLLVWILVCAGQILHQIFPPLQNKRRGFDIDLQYNFNGSNTLGTMKKCLRHGQFELMSVNQVRWHNRDIFFDFLSHEGMLCVLIRIASSK